MKAVEISAYGKPDVLRLGERPAPVPGAGELLIRVARQRRQPPGRAPAHRQLSGAAGRFGHSGPGGRRRDRVGRRAALAQAGFKVGDRVCALVAGGGYAQLCVAPVGQCLPVPKGLSDIEAASLPETFFTVWSNVFDRVKLQPGETLLVQGGTSGIGVTAIQMAKALGATVIATAGSDEKCQACLKLGADHAINYKTQDFAEEAKKLTGGTGVNVILDMVAGSYVAREIECLAEDGRLVIIAVQGGVKSEFNAGLVLRKRLAITGSTLRPRPVEFKAAIARSLKAKVWPLLEKRRHQAGHPQHLSGWRGGQGA